MPMVGASEAGGFGLGMDAELRGVDEVPEDQGIPMPHKSQLAAQDRVLPQPAATEQWTPEDPASPSAPNSPASGDGLRRRLPPAEDVEASLVPKQIWPEAEHTAPPPQTLGKPREEDRVKRRRGEREDSKGAGNGSNLPRDVLEKALKEKNEKIAELERQMALKGGEKKELLRDESGASLGGLPRSPPRGRGSSVLLLFGPASASWLLVVLVLCSAGAQVAAPVLLGLFFAPSLPSPSVAPTSAPSGVLSTSRAPAAPAPASPAAPVPVPPTVPTFPPDAEIDDSEVVWLGFSTTTTTGATTAVTTTEAATTTTTEAAAPEQAWHVKLAGHFCHEPGLEQTSGPQGNYELDVTIGWHSAVPLTLATCQRACEDIADWGCRFISWGGPAAAAKWCYLHRQCGDVMRVPVYQVLEMNYTGSPQRLRRRLGSPRTAVSPLRGRTTSKLPRLARRSLRRLQAATEVEVASRWLSQYSLETALVALSLLLPLLGWYQARLAAYVGLQASRQSFSKQLRALLAAPADFRGAPLTFAPSTLEAKQLTERGHNILKDIADGDEFLPIPLVRCLSALSEVLGVVVCCAMASAGQAVPAVTLTLALGLAAYLHRLRLPFLHQIRRLQRYLEEAAVLRMQHLAECHEVLRAHGRLQSFCEDYEALCFDSARAVIAADAAERWLYTRLYCLIAVLLGFLSFPLLTQAAWPSELVFAAAGAAVAQVVWLPEAAVDLVKHGARLTHGLAALRRMRQLCKETEAEELESPILKLPETLKDEGESKGPEKMRGRSGKVALGDVMLDDPERETAKTQEQEQSASVAGFPVEKVPADWPYFGAIELEEVTFRYSAQLSPALSSCSLRLPAGKALLLCGPESCGKSSLLRQLLRLHVPEAGRVLVDNVDLRCVGLATLRGRVAVVPQEVMLYRGTWRQNLDPMDEFNEEDLQLVLRLTRLENWMLHHSCRLDDEVDAKAGPLVALCRAMLRLVRKRSKLLLLDAVTCRLAPAFDADLTAILLRYCRRGGIAVLQTSRRVQQAPLYDEVAAMSNGRILEQGTAKKLWVKDGALRRMAKEQGLDSNRMTKPDAVSARLASVWGWEVSPQEEAAWQDEFAVAMKKVKGDKDRRASK
ncbi:unnamed protein product [Effrenium voratum]|nr:unnamed protein product [Effrenium voratum]